MWMKRSREKYISEVPELLAQWDYAKNNPKLSPEQLTIGSNKKVFWKCQEGHTWEETIYKRGQGKSCPYCTNKRVLAGYNDLETLYPQIAAEWNDNDIDINSVVVGSAKKVSWRCRSCGFVWTATVRSRTQKGTGCPQCGLKKRGETRHKLALKRSGSLSDPRLLVDWDYEKNFPLTPENVTPQSNQKVWWKCSECGYSWSAKINNRSNGRGCPCCSNRKLVKEVNDLATKNPKLASEWDWEKNKPITPSDVFPKSGKKYYWICPQGHSYKATVLHRASGTNCPYCNEGRQTSFAEQAVFYYVKQAFPDAISRYKEIFNRGMELDIFIPSSRLAIEYDGAFWHKEEKVNRERKKYRICQEHHIRLIRIRETETSQEGIADEIFHIDKLDNRKQLELLIRYVLDQIDPKSNFWTRKDGTLHTVVDVNIVRDEAKIRRYMTDIKDSLQDCYPDIAAEWHPSRNGDLTPSKFKCGSDYRAWWRCHSCGHEWQTSIGHRVNGTGCPVCYQKRNQEQHPLSKKVFQFSKDGTLVREWNSISEAGRELSISSSNICMCMNHKRSSAGGFIWRRTYDKEK